MPDDPTDAGSLLIVEDDHVLRTRLARAFRDRGFAVREVSDVVTAAEIAGSEAPEYALVDLRLQGGSGLEVVQALLALDSTTRVVVLTGYGSIATALEAIRMGATSYLTKPADVDDILAAFGRANHADDGPGGAEPAVPSLARVEWEHINRVLADCDGNVSKAARLLGIHRRSLQRKLAKHPVVR